MFPGADSPDALIGRSEGWSVGDLAAPMLAAGT